MRTTCLPRSAPRLSRSHCCLPLRVAQAPSRAVDRRRHQPEARRRAGDLARRATGRLHHSRNELGRERLRDRDLDRRRRHRPIAPGHQRARVEPAAGVVARRRVARVRLGPRRQAPAVSHCASRGGEAERLTSGEEGVNSFAWSPSGRADRVHDARPGVGRDQGARKALGRHQDRGSGSALHASACARRGDAKTTKQLTKGNFVVGSFDWSPDGTAASPSIIAPRAIRRTAAPPTSPWSTSPPATRQRGGGAGRPRLESAVVARRHAARVRDVDGQAVLLFPEQRHRDRVARARRPCKP